ncbi:hypothetical protein [Paraclostridium bifermentans]|uniref:hypothetical protein n=1 Tax=Paraclostridium bifermentans TaxID=1490 RepID=UPI00189C4ABE|nr:hypothetical protein [Paraclostridium bifermentans]
MLTVEQMTNSTNEINDLNDVSLKLYKRFFIQVLCSKVFIYTTIEGIEITLIFNPTNFMHVLGAQHILGDNYKSVKFNEEVDNESMTFDILNTRNPIQFRDDLDRFLGFSNIYYILTNCNAIYFDKSIFENSVTPKRKSTMDFKYILFQDLYNKKLHLGLDTFNKGKTYYPKSLLVTSELNDKFIKGQDPLYITNIKIIDRSTKVILEDIHISEVALEKEDSK